MSQNLNNDYKEYDAKVNNLINIFTKVRRILDISKYRYELDKIQQKKPLYIDALQGVAIIYEIQEKYDDAIKIYDEILQVYREEQGWTEGEPVRVIIAKKQSLLENK